MELLVQLITSGLTNGAVYSLAAFGFVLIYKASDVLNFAQGELLLVGAYMTYFFVGQLSLPWPVGILLALGVAVLVGVVVERLVLRPLIGEPILSVIMVTIGLASVLKAIVLGVWTPLPRAFPAFIPSGKVNVLGVIVGSDRLWAIGLAGLMLGGFSLFFRRSSDGIAMRAVADDQQAALSMGISVRRVFAVTWSIAAVSATIAGLLLANSWFCHIVCLVYGEPVSFSGGQGLRGHT